MNKDYKNTVLNGYIVQATDNFNHAYDLGYGKGYEDGKGQQDKLWAGEHYRQELTAKGYYRGLEDAWETAKQIVSISSAKMSDIFGEVYAESVFEKFTADQAMKKIMDYEEQQKPHSLLDAYTKMMSDAKKPCDVCSHNNHGLCVQPKKNPCRNYSLWEMRKESE